VFATVGAAALGCASLVAASAQSAGAAVSSVSPITYQSSSMPLQDLGAVNLAAIAGTGSPPPSTGSPNGNILNAPDNAVGPGTGNGPSLVHGSIGGGSTVSSTSSRASGFVGFEGISGPAQAAVNGGGDLEPPDQGTCVGPSTNGGGPIDFEIINNAVAAYSTSGTQLLATTPTYALFNQASTAFLSDPRCMYDASTHRWFFTEFVVGAVGPGNTEVSPSTQFVAVSKTSDPLGSYEVFGIDTTDVANSAGGCPCFGDYDQIGADQNGFYIATNEFSTAEPFFNGAVVYAISKQHLETAANGAALPAVARYAITSDAFGQPYHVSPASTPSDGTYAPNTEFFVESNSDANSDNHLLVYALTGTQVLANNGNPALSATELVSEPYAFPPNATQEAGPIPLGATVGATSPSTIQTDFNAVQEVTYTDGNLYAELDTAIGTSATPNAGISWFILNASSDRRGISASLQRQGYVASAANLMYPDIVVNGSGHGILDFSLSGTANYPSAAYMTFTNAGPGGQIRIAGAGTAPEDGFTCYPAFVGSTSCRWGDYSGGQYWNGRVYGMAEYIPPSARDFYTNWGTFAWSVNAS
jgi:hypothetical protein